MDSRVIWLRHPGIVSVFKPREGMVHECNTASDEINMQIVISIGNTT